MAKKKKKSPKKVAPKAAEPTAEEIFLSHTRKLGIPDEGLLVDAEEMRATWTGSGTACSQILSTIEKKVVDNEFVRQPLPETNEPIDDPVVEELEKLKLTLEARRESMFRKSKGGWTATVMMEHNLGDSSDEDTTAVFFFIEEDEE